MNLKELAGLVGVILIIQFIAVLSLLLGAFFDAEAFVFAFIYGFLFAVLFLLWVYTTRLSIKILKPLLNGGDIVSPFADPTAKTPNPLDKEFTNLKNEIKNGRRPKS